MNWIRNLLHNARLHGWAIVSCFVFVLLLKEIGIWPYLVSLYQALIPLFIGATIAFLLEHFISLTERYMKRFLATTLVYWIIIFGLGAVLMFLGPPLYQQLQVFLSYVPTFIGQIQSILQERVVPVSTPSSMDTIMSQGYTLAIDTILNISATVNRLMFGFLAAYFISLDKSLIVRLFHRLKLTNEKQLVRFFKTSSNVMNQYIVGLSLDILFLFVTFFLTFLLLQFPSPLLYAAILSLLNMLPYIGPMVGTLIVLLVSWVTYANPWLVVLLIWLVQQVEANYVQPFIFKKTMDLHPILTLTMLFIGSAWFGILGMILAPIMAAIFQIAMRSYIFSRKNESVGSWEEVWYNINDIEINDEDE